MGHPLYHPGERGAGGTVCGLRSAFAARGAFSFGRNKHRPILATASGVQAAALVQQLGCCWRPKMPTADLGVD